MADEEKNLIEILEDNIIIDTNKFINYVQSPHCGAIATFAGTTRVMFDGKDVLELRYEAYVPMAMRCIESIYSSARSSWSLNAIAVAHHLGPVPVGKTSVFIVDTNINRADALEACQLVIDEVKASVPIWKKEVYMDGVVWKENSEFMERRDGLGKPGLGQCCQKKVLVEEGLEKRGCCAGKVKVNVTDP
ncbi:molybdopterin synthase catalytic subunit [Phtheirospermum japonicum]|uniref:Molybdopterin synthase catalytic subunit n=1 Tax=Phtheirospermum japonicum TaxID=374723 RepID=A0A830B1Z2_9LAMI|nr:molybdopterin synthase catalytic subunit [Phtheirospermum japonicum]